MILTFSYPVLIEQEFTLNFLVYRFYSQLDLAYFLKF
jgi:hypothetical protein